MDADAWRTVRLDGKTALVTGADRGQGAAGAELTIDGGSLLGRPPARG